MTEPVVVRLTIEAHNEEEELAIPADQWAAWSDWQRRVYLNEEADKLMKSTVGVGWQVVSGASEEWFGEEG